MTTQEALKLAIKALETPPGQPVSLATKMAIARLEVLIDDQDNLYCSSCSLKVYNLAELVERITNYRR